MASPTQTSTEFEFHRLGDSFDKAPEREILDDDESPNEDESMYAAARRLNRTFRTAYQRRVKIADIGTPRFCMHCHASQRRREELENQAGSSKTNGGDVVEGDAYVYEKLPDEDSIRVLELQPAVTYEGPLCAELVVVNRNTTAYNALSYTWGGVDATGELDVGSGRLEITGNLELALRALRREDEVLRIWVDAVCINQVDFQEKAIQVARMDEIYCKAEKVLAWLGPASATSAEAIDFLEVLAELSKAPEYDQDVRPHPVILEPTTFSIDADLAAEIEATRASAQIDDVLQRLWFSRMWVVQEILLAQDLVLHIGDCSISWEQFRRALKMLWAAEQHTPILCSQLYDGGAIYHPLGLMYARDQLKANNSGTTLFKDYTMQIYTRTRDFRRWGCKDDRDRVFAILGFIPQDSSLRITPDYIAEPSEVFVDFARQHILHEGLTVLLFAGNQQHKGPTVRERCETIVKRYAAEGDTTLASISATDLFSAPEWLQSTSLPSWVPELRPSLIKPVHRFWRPQNFNVARDRTAAVVLDKNCPHTLAVRGKIFDTITQPIPTSRPDSAEPMTHKETLFYIGRVWHLSKASYSRLGGYPLGSSTHEQIFDSVLTAANTNNKLLPLIQSHAPGWTSTMLWHLKSVAENGTPGITDEYRNSPALQAEIGAFVHTVSWLVLHDCVALTEMGFMGLVPRESRVGDRVAWVNGLQSFLVLREKPVGFWEVVGPAFLAGAMDGEVFGSGEVEEEWVHLV